MIDVRIMFTELRNFANAAIFIKWLSKVNDSPVHHFEIHDQIQRFGSLQIVV